MEENNERDECSGYAAGRGNNKPNYKKGPRRKVMAIVMYAGAICLKSSSLICENHRMMLRRINDMVEEGILEKEHINGCYFATIPRNSVKYKDIVGKYYSDELLSHFTQNGISQIRRLRTVQKKKRSTKSLNSKEKREISLYNHKTLTDADHVMRNSETIMFMDGVGVEYLPGGYEYFESGDLPLENSERHGKPLLSENTPIRNAFYTFNEVANTSREEFISENRSSRANGFLFSTGGNYIIYNFSNSFREIPAATETRVMNTMNNSFLPARKMEYIKGQIVLVSNAEVEKEMIELSGAKHALWFNNLTASSIHTYMLPLDYNGQRLAQLMTYELWEDRLIYLVCKSLDQKLLKTDNPTFANDGIMDVHFKNRKSARRYVFFYLIPDIIRFRSYINAVLATDNRDEFEIFAFDFQAPAIKQVVGNKAVITPISFEKTYAAFMQKYDDNSRI